MKISEFFFFDIGITVAEDDNPGPSTSKSGSSTNRHYDENTHLMDTSKPVGDACRDDGTLKDAKEMDWLNSPTENNRRELTEDHSKYNRAIIEDHFRASDNDGSVLDLSSTETKSVEAPKVKVR
jgi:hypothetical protein